MLHASNKLTIQWLRRRPSQLLPSHHRRGHREVRCPQTRPGSALSESLQDQHHALRPELASLSRDQGEIDANLLSLPAVFTMSPRDTDDNVMKYDPTERRKRRHPDSTL